MNKQKRLGYFTGHVYEDNNAEECCVVLTDREARSVAMQNRKYERVHNNCKGCFGCPEAKKATLAK